MKKYLGALALVMGLVFAGHAQGVVSFKKEKHDFGKITEGTQAAYTFEFTNTGNAPVIISNVQPSCGCTTPNWTREPIMPGRTGKVMASFDSNGRPGAFNKTIAVINNGRSGQIILTFQGTVDPKK